MAVSSEVWEMARAIYENTPNMTHQELLEKLQEIFEDDAPKSRSSISRKAKKENWQFKTGIEVIEDAEIIEETPRTKTHQNAPKRTNRDIEKNISNINDNKGLRRNAQKKRTHQENAPNALNITEQKIEQELNSLVMTAQQRAEKIIKHRKRLNNMGDIQERLIDITNNALDELENYLDCGKCVNDDENNGDNTQDDNVQLEIFQTIQANLFVLGKLSLTLDRFTNTQKLIAEQEFALCGITADDFTQSEQERRLGALSLLDGIADEEREARHRLKGQLMERLEWIEDLENGD